MASLTTSTRHCATVGNRELSFLKRPHNTTHKKSFQFLRNVPPPFPYGRILFAHNTYFLFSFSQQLGGTLKLKPFSLFVERWFLERCWLGREVFKLKYLLKISFSEDLETETSPRNHRRSRATQYSPFSSSIKSVESKYQLQHCPLYHFFPEDPHSPSILFLGHPDDVLAAKWRVRQSSIVLFS